MLLENTQERVNELTVLLHEADHRIKNSLQIASSLMQAEARRSGDDDLRDALVSAASRIQAISMVHDALQASAGESQVDVRNLMEMMCEQMQGLCEGKAEMHLHFGDTPLNLPITFARPLMLLVNEIIVNALRHAFPADQLGQICVSIGRAGDDIIVAIKDDGVGLTVTESGHTGFGTELMKMMTRQIGGKLSTDSTSGTCFTLMAPLPLSIDHVQAARA
tara:strand:- start:259492 stop:260151 length:660 start_codon:yes stop_codon:yes gene_type:complete